MYWLQERQSPYNAVFWSGENRIWSGKSQRILLLTEGGHPVMNKQDVLFLPYDLQSRKCCCCLGNPGKCLGVRSFIRDD